MPASPTRPSSCNRLDGCGQAAHRQPRWSGRTTREALLLLGFNFYLISMPFFSATYISVFRTRFCNSNSRMRASNNNTSGDFSSAFLLFFLPAISSCGLESDCKDNAFPDFLKRETQNAIVLEATHNNDSALRSCSHRSITSRLSLRVSLSEQIL